MANFPPCNVHTVLGTGSDSHHGCFERIQPRLSSGCCPSMSWNPESERRPVPPTMSNKGLDTAHRQRTVAVSPHHVHPRHIRRDCLIGPWRPLRSQLTPQNAVFAGYESLAAGRGWFCDKRTLLCAGTASDQQNGSRAIHFLPSPPST